MITPSSILCLNCRKAGHSAKQCKEEWAYRWKEWFYGAERQSFGSNSTKLKKSDSLCKRCRELRIIEFIEQKLPWSSSAELNEAAEQGGPLFRNLGTVRSTIFRQDCSLCRCLFALIPYPTYLEEEIWLLSDWTVKRLEGGISTDTPEKQRSSKSLLVFLAPAYSQGINSEAHQGDALCLLPSQKDRSDQTLRGRFINQKHVDYQLVRNWLGRCTKLHPITCKPAWSEDLQGIRLLDVRTRQVIPYPEGRCDYLALSYVWGSTPQKIYQEGQPLPGLPKTIEDAMIFVRKLGKQYLWVDSLCINQEDEADKLSQINKMSIIYRGAYATIVALSGTSADAGLPRVSSNESVIPQLSCTIKGRTLLSLMPNLSEQIFVCPWGKRAWTLQEALLSRRCIYLSNHQMYFECNAMNCCESIDETNSWVHDTFRDEKFLQHGHSEPLIGAGVLRSPFVGSSPGNDRFQQYGVLTNLYNYRYMTNQSDALNAFSGIVQYLTEFEYKTGFFWGLPIEDLNWALLWSQRLPSDRRQAFPSWSWTGWHGYKFAAEPENMQETQGSSTFLRIWKRSDDDYDVFEELFNAEYKALQLKSKSGYDSLHAIASPQSRFDPTDLFQEQDHLLLPRWSSHLFIQGLVFTFIPDLYLSYGTSGSYRRFAQPIFPAERKDEYAVQKYIEILILSNDAQLEYLDNHDREESEKREEKFLLLAKEDSSNDTVCLHTLSLRPRELDMKGMLYERGTVAMIMIQKFEMDLLMELNPSIESLVLT